MKTLKRNMLKYLVAIVLLAGFSKAALSQVVLTGANMESATGWTVYYGSASHATHQFNYTTTTPANGSGGCLRVTSTANTNTLFWQKIKLKAGKKYILDGAVKTSNVASFFCEFYLSTVAPTDGVDYSPNSNGDVVLGLSTWAGCGPNLDALMSVVACTGKRSFVCPGTAGTDVDVYFAVKTGTFSTNFTEVLIDNVSVTEVDDSKLLSSDYGTMDQTALTISSVMPSITAEKFRNGLTAFPNATISILGAGDAELVVADLDLNGISAVKKVKVTGNVGTSFYTVSTRALSAADTIISTSIGVLDPIAKTIAAVPYNAKAIQLKTAVIVPATATASIVNASNVAVANTVTLVDGYKVEVKAENGTKNYYTIGIGTDSMAVESFTDYKTTISGLTNKIWELDGNSEVKITGANPLQGSYINLKSDNVWLYFDSIRPQAFSNSYLGRIFIDGNAAVNLSNIRMVQYYNGTAVISQPSSFKPLTVYASDSLKGTSADFGLYTYYGASSLGTMNDKARSFLLKKGYMATFAMDEAGTGFSKVYVATDNDIIVNTLPAGLYDRVSYVRVVPWRWVTKKGWCGGSKEAADILNCTWQYDWDNVATSTNNVEYIPMRHNSGWNAYSNIDNKQNSTHSLGFNEPERTDQANMTVAQAIAAWPNLLKSGLRLGSPCPSDGGLNWLYSFIDSCDKINYRVDFVAMHWYMGGQTARQFYDRLKSIYDRTKRPIWITEWNNGANWTSAANGKPTYEEQATKIGQFLYMLDTTSFVERYSIYEWVEDTRQMYYSNSSVLTPAGKVYRDKVSPKAYNPGKGYALPVYKPQVAAAINPTPANNTLNIKLDTVLRWENGNVAIPATSYKVYFGTTNPPPYVATVTTASYKPGQLLPNKVYTWSVNTVTSFGEKTGTTWKFLTGNFSNIGLINESGKLIIFPNPVGDRLNINGLQKEETIDIYTLVGEKVYTGKTKEGVDVSRFAKGVYILKVNGLKPLNFIKE